MSEAPSDAARGTRDSRAAAGRRTTAGRLLGALTGEGGYPLDALARLAAIPSHELERCRDEGHALDLAAQLRLAAVIIAEVPSHARAARQLHEQAQAALRLAAGADRQHLVYPKEHFR